MKHIKSDQIRFKKDDILELGLYDKNVQIAITYFGIGKLSWNEALYLMIVSLVKEKQNLIDHFQDFLNSRTI